MVCTLHILGSGFTNTRCQTPRWQTHRQSLTRTHLLARPFADYFRPFPNPQNAPLTRNSPCSLGEMGVVALPIFLISATPSERDQNSPASKDVYHISTNDNHPSACTSTSTGAAVPNGPEDCRCCEIDALDLQGVYAEEYSQKLCVNGDNSVLPTSHRFPIPGPTPIVWGRHYLVTLLIKANCCYL